MKTTPVRLLIDGAFDEHADLAANPWVRQAQWLGRCTDLQVLWLDRGRAPEAEGVEYLSFPAHRQGACAADSMLIQSMCDLYRIEVFASAGQTTPLATPMLMLVDQGVLATSEPASAPHDRGERELAIDFAQRYLCSSAPVRAALLARGRAIAPATALVARQDWTLRADSQERSTWGQQVAAICRELRRQARAGMFAPFFVEWKRLRVLQSTVDV
ncbi:MAG: hypothetical protein ABI699_14340 [Caldimonas sp.]